MSDNFNVVKAKEKDIGDGLIVKRSIPTKEIRDLGPFVFWDHMGPVTLGGEKKLKVRAHPHIGLATLTYLFSGEIMHRDSLGYEQKITPGAVNWMTAGKGVSHSERASFDEDTVLEGIQVWIGLPKDLQEIDPSFEHYTKDSLPEFKIDDAKVKLIAGNYKEYESPVKVYSDLFYMDVFIDGKAKFSKKDIHELGVYVLEDDVSINNKSYDKGSLIMFKDENEINIKSKTKSRVMIFGGEAFKEKRHKWWNFVHTDKERIEQAKEDWKKGLFGNVINETESIPLPEDK